jgi:hypothetical protein
MVSADLQGYLPGYNVNNNDSRSVGTTYIIGSIQCPDAESQANALLRVYMGYSVVMGLDRADDRLVSVGIRYFSRYRSYNEVVLGIISNTLAG